MDKRELVLAGKNPDLPALPCGHHSAFSICPYCPEEPKTPTPITEKKKRGPKTGAALEKRLQKLNRGYDYSDTFQVFIREMAKHDFLPNDQQKELVKRYQDGDEKAGQKLVESSLKFVFNVAYKFRNRGIEVTELISEGALGVLDAAKRFDLTKPTTFMGYAVWYIRKYMNDAVCHKARVVKVSYRDETVANKGFSAPNYTRQVIGGDHEVGILPSKKFDENQRLKIEESLRRVRTPLRFDAPVNAGEPALGDMLPGDGLLEIESAIDEWDSKKLVQKATSRLEEKQKMIIRMLFGLDGNRPMSLQEVAEAIGCSVAKVNQLKTEALEECLRVAA